MALSVFGISHACTDLDNLERLTFDTEEVEHALALLRRQEEVQECVILSTCNRIEIYSVCQEEFPAYSLLRDFIKHAKPAGVEESIDNFYYKTGNDAVKHLFAVSSGLDSLVVGENEIAGQVKRAFKFACDRHSTGVLLNKLFHSSFRTSKRVKNETTINEGNCSVGCVAVDIAEEQFPSLEQSQVLLIGAGDIGKVVARTFADRNVGKLLIANRSQETAIELAHEVGGRAISLDQIHEHLGQVDIIVSGTGSPDYLLRCSEIEELLERHPQQRLLMVDIALPRDFDPQIATLPNVTLKNLYDLKNVVKRNIRKREQELPRVEGIIADELQKFLKWKESLKINSTIKVLTQNFEIVRRQEMERYRNRFSDEVFPQIETFTKSLNKKYLHLIISNLKSLYQVCDLDEGQMHILEHLFDSQGVKNDEAHCRYKRQQSCSDTNADCHRPASEDLSETGN